MHVLRYSLVSFGLVGGLVATADAHISVGSGPAAANKSQKIRFDISHGCEDANENPLDTVEIKVVIPTGVTSVRGLTSDFGTVSYTKDGDGAVKEVIWRKPLTEVKAGDDTFYELTIRARVGNVPFTRLQFNIIQTCSDQLGNEVVVPWDQPPGSQTGEPAAMLTVVPARMPGWNKFVAPVAIAEADLGLYFGDALIVWRGNAAFSSNPNTMDQINATAGVTALTGDIQADDELWVRY